MSPPPKASPQAKAAIDRFLAFYAILAEAKQMAMALADPEAETSAEDIATEAPQTENTSDNPAPASDTPEAPAESAAEATQRPANAMDIFLRLRIAICPTGSPPPSLDGYPDIGYVMAALADEAMLHHVVWPGRHQWLHMLLEDSLYGSRIAGERIFTLGRAISDGDIVARDDLAVTILLALSLDFRGRWRGVNDEGAINILRQKLYEIVYGQRAPEQLDWASALPNALQPVLDQGHLVRLPRVLPWLAAIAAVLIFAFGMSTVIWSMATAGVLENAQKIQNLGATTTRGQAP